MTALNIATFNCAGMVDSFRRAALFDQFRKLPAHIMLVQETHSSTSTVDNGMGTTNGNL